MRQLRRCCLRTLEFLASSKSWSPLCRLTILFSNPLGLQSLGYQTAEMISGLCFYPCEFHPTLARSGKPFRAVRSAHAFDVLNFTWKGARAARARGASRPPSPLNHLVAQKRQEAARKRDKPCLLQQCSFDCRVRCLQQGCHLRAFPACKDPMVRGALIAKMHTRRSNSSIVGLFVSPTSSCLQTAWASSSLTVIHKYLFASWFLGSSGSPCFSYFVWGGF